MVVPLHPARELDADAIGRAARGDAAACRDLVRTYEARVFALASRMLPGRGRAVVEDVAQDTFLRAFQALPRFDPRGTAKLSTWLLTIAARRCLDEARRTKRAPTVPLGVDLASSTVSAFERAAQSSLERAVRKAVATMPDDQRAAFVLRAFHDLPYDDIARALDVEEGTVKSRIARARAHLREALGPSHQEAQHG